MSVRIFPIRLRKRVFTYDLLTWMPSRSLDDLRLLERRRPRELPGRSWRARVALHALLALHAGRPRSHVALRARRSRIAGRSPGSRLASVALEARSARLARWSWVSGDARVAALSLPPDRVDAAVAWWAGGAVSSWLAVRSAWSAETWLARESRETLKQHRCRCIVLCSCWKKVLQGN